MTTPVVIPPLRYPVGPITPHGMYHVLRGDIPDVTLTAYDGSIVFDLMGGRAIPDQTRPESVRLKSLKGLIPPWQTIDQKGATQDGITFVDALYDPIEVEAGVIAKGRNPIFTRQVTRDLIASLDVKQTSDLSWFTHDMGRWWAPVRWFKTPADAIAPIHSLKQELSLRLRVDNGFWRGTDDVAQFSGGSGFVDRINIGDQPRFDRYTCFGPGTFRFANGPASTDMVEFGPLLSGQVAQIRNDPRKRGVVDLTTTPPSAQDQAQFADALASLDSFTQVLSVFQSIFGILGTGPIPPQGNMYSLLKGRFSNAAAIPAKSPGRPAQTYQVKVEILGGDGNSTVLVGGTPLRRWPF